MKQSKTVHSNGHVPFSWEKRPGESKVVTNHHGCLSKETSEVKLQPPPCPVEGSRISTHDIIIPLPPCKFQAPAAPPEVLQEEASRRRILMTHSWQLIKSALRAPRKISLLKKKWGLDRRKGALFDLSSCKQSCSVRDDNLVRVSQVPCERDKWHRS
uniref:Uncharacterized protein n=1 Tax=Salix viminalis TaxID=40686 RepID=A0A6N2MIX3_SALVM